jgi:azurin
MAYDALRESRILIPRKPLMSALAVRTCRAAQYRLPFVAVVLLLILSGCRTEPKPEQRLVDLYIQSDGDFLTFRPDTLTCRTGARVRITFHHAGQILTTRHNWVLMYPAALESLSKEALANDGVLSKDDARVIAETPLCDKGMTVTTEFVAPLPGDYPFFCSTHPEDMRGALHVTK